LHKEFLKVEIQFIYSIHYSINGRIHLHTATTYLICKAQTYTKETYIQNHSSLFKNTFILTKIHSKNEINSNDQYNKILTDTYQTTMLTNAMKK